MPVNKKQLMRLVRLVARLKENRYPTCAGFARELRRCDVDENLNITCTAKTIQRDIRILKDDFGAPIAFDSKQRGYYLRDHGWTFACPLVFNDIELLSVVFGARLAEHVFPAPLKSHVRDAVDYLLTVNNTSRMERVRMDSLVVIPSNRAVMDDRVFMTLFAAWQNCEVCRIRYLDSKGKATTREFEPHALIVYDGVWYVKGRNPRVKESRTLAVPRMQSVTRLGRTFAQDRRIIKSATEEGLFNPVTVSDVVVRCDPYLSNLVNMHPLHPDQKVSSLPGGGCELRVASMSRYRLITWVMRQCGQARVLSPVEVREAVVGFAKKMIEGSEQSIRQ